MTSLETVLEVINAYRLKCCQNSDAAMTRGDRDEAAKWLEHALAAVAISHQVKVRGEVQKTSAWTDEERAEMKSRRESDYADAWERGPDGKPLRVSPHATNQEK